MEKMKHREDMNTRLCAILTDTIKELGHTTGVMQNQYCVCDRNRKDGFVKEDLTASQYAVVLSTLTFIRQAVREMIERLPPAPPTHRHGLPGGTGI